MQYTFQTRWADMDPNQHLRHTAFLDYAAQSRVNMFSDIEYPMEEVLKAGMGPILFREDIRYLREVRLNEMLTVGIKLKAARKDGSRWTFLHEFLRSDDILAATLLVEGAWLDLQKRKLAIPDEKMAHSILDKIPRADDFEWLPESKKK